jgi:hypothetical protein
VFASLLAYQTAVDWWWFAKGMARKEAPTAAASRESRERRVASSSSNNNFSSIRNFRPVSSFKETKIYRCGSTDVLGAKLRCLSETETETKTKTTETNRSWSEADTMVLEDAGLVLDLRSPPERREDDAQRWMNMNKGLLSLLSRDGGGGGSSNSSSNSNSGGNCCTSTTRQPRRRRRPIRLVTIPLEASASVSRDGAIASEDIFGRNNYNNSNVGEDSRYVIRLDVLNRSELLGYVRKKWLSPGLTAASSILVSPAEASPPPVSSAASMPTSTSAAASPFTYRIEEANKIMTELNRRGLAGLNEAILETRSGQKGMCLALQLMTLYREAVVARADSETKRSTRSSNDDECNKHETTTQNNHSIVFHCVQGKDRCVESRHPVDLFIDLFSCIAVSLAALADFLAQFEFPNQAPPRSFHSLIRCVCVCVCVFVCLCV